MSGGDPLIDEPSAVPGGPSARASTPLLDVRDLEVTIDMRGGGQVRPVREASFSVAAGETVALVGESGCGKSMTCLAVAGLLPRRARISGGAARLGDVDLAALGSSQMRRLRREQIAMVFQDATNGLNPVKSIGWQVAEAAQLREGVSGAAARARAIELLARVGMPDPERRAREFPHQLSGGMNQRAMIALAMAGPPKLLIADEATTALDVTIQAQILELIAGLRRDLGMGVIFVTHDLGLVAEMADAVAVMYAGRVVERASAAALFAAPRHPYAAGLLASLPRVDRKGALHVIEGQVPPLTAMPPGCAFAPRCPRAEARCRAEAPPLLEDGPAGRAVACWRPSPEEAAP